MQRNRLAVCGRGRGNDAGAVTHVDIREPAYKGSLTGGAKSLFRLPPEGPALPRLVVAEASIDALSVAAIENVRADTLYAATGGGMGPGTIAALISASIATCRTSGRSEHDCVRGRQALGDAAGFMHAAAGRAALQESRGRHARPLATPMGAHSPIATTLAQSAILRPKLWERLRMMNDPRQYAPATLRNRDFILGILRDVLPTKGVILEIASGSGEHVVYFARNLPSLVFQPSDREPDALQSVAAWVKATRVTNVRAPVVLDASQSPWPIASADGIICINMVHISPWDATLGLIRGAAAILPPTAPFYLYGPYKREGFATTPSNQAFDRSLRDRNPTWGLRDLEAVAAIAQSVGFSVPTITEMPANNLSVVFHRI